MASSEKTTLNKSQNKYVQLRCLNCKRFTKHKILTSVLKTGEDEYEEEGFSISWWNNFEILECQGCSSVSLREQHTSSEDFHDENHDGITEHIYPERSVNSLEARDYEFVPESLIPIYKETIQAFNQNLFILCGTGVRALVEGVCEANGIKTGNVERVEKGVTKIKRSSNLEGKINGLYENGVLTKTHANSLHEHRFLGNEAVHELSAPTKKELRLAIEIIEHVFDSLYEIPEKAKELKANRSKRKKRGF
jgi:hypothetical protein